MQQKYSIPANLNMFILVLAIVISVSALWGAAHADSIWLKALSVVLFSFSANTLFALLHESVHLILHPNRLLNELLGQIPAAFFPTSLSLQRGYHLIHHKNNRGPLERFDYIHDGDIKWLKYAQWYGILTGVYWFFTVLGTVLFLIIPHSLRLSLLLN